MCPQFDIETRQIRNAKLRRTSLSSPGTCEPLHEPTNLHRAAIGLLGWVLLNRVQSWRVTSRLMVCDGLWWFVEYRTIFSQSLEVVDTSRLIHRISLNLSLDVLNPAPPRILLPDSLSLSLNFTQAIISLATYALLTVRNSFESVCNENISRTCAEDKDNTSWETGPKQGPLISLPVQIFHKNHTTFINS
jgi:hypothetical protein